MLEGLEIAEHNFHEIQGNKDFRFDSQFFTQMAQKNYKLQYKRIGDCLLESQYGISIEMNESHGTPIYRMNEIHSMMTDIRVNKYAIVNNTEKDKFTLKDREVLFNRTNSYDWVGRTGLYKKVDQDDYIFASYLVKFVPNESLILPEYLVSFLNTPQGIRELKRRARQSINQTNINPEEVKEVEIPLLNKEIQNKIKNIFNIAHDSRIKSDDIYNRAENQLSIKLGFQKCILSPDAINIKYLSESFTTTGRIDAEYYQKKYDDYTALIKRYANGWDTVQNAFDLNGANFEPEADEEYRYIELSNIGGSGNITGCTTELGANLPSRARRKVKEGQIIVSSIEGSLDSCALVSKAYDGALCSTGFYVLQAKKINPETSLVLFKSPLLQQLLKQNCSGTILTAINKDEFLNIPIPLIEEGVQKQIADYVQESFILKQQSENLLEVAKRAVEIAIEQDEATALKYIEDNS